MTHRMALHLVKDNIAVTAIAPGAFASDMNKNARDHAAEVSSHIPAGPTVMPLIPARAETSD